MQRQAGRHHGPPPPGGNQHRPPPSRPSNQPSGQAARANNPRYQLPQVAPPKASKNNPRANNPYESLRK